jgi:monoamine oxidase
MAGRGQAAKLEISRSLTPALDRWKNILAILSQPFTPIRYYIFENALNCEMGKSVIIIGGGIAGLSAARELLRHGSIVTLLEAKKRFGGRMHTIREGKLPIELGAEFIHGKSKPLLNAIREAGLSMHEAPDSNQMFENGKLKPIHIWDKVSEMMNRISPRGADRSFKEFIERQKCDDRTRRLMTAFVEGFDAARTERISAHALLKAERSAEKMDGDMQARVDEGYTALIEYFENEIRWAEHWSRVRRRGGSGGNLEEWKPSCIARAAMNCFPPKRR